MPTPGSHDYDVERQRLRKQHESDGVPDQKANEQANRDLQREGAGGVDPAKDTDRARGPKGER